MILDPYITKFMEHTGHYTGFDKTFKDKLQEELTELDREIVEIDGARFKPSQCYRLDIDPPHILFNTNCPDELKQKVQAILSKYIPHVETGAS
jgi:hypothetical protein